jgi:hypothetical protein
LLDALGAKFRHFHWPIHLIFTNEGSRPFLFAEGFPPYRALVAIIG